MTAGVVRRGLLLIPVPAVLIALAVFTAASIERRNALHSAEAVQQSQWLLAAMLDQETGSRGYFDTHQRVFLEPWLKGTRDFAAARTRIRPFVAGDDELEHELGSQVEVANMWHADVAGEIRRFDASGRAPSIATALSQKRLMDSFRAANATFMQTLDDRRNSALSRATWLAVLLTAGLSGALALGGVALLSWRTRREDAQRRREAELRALMQVSNSEEESRLLLIDHIKRTLPGTGAAVLNRNNSDDRLEPYVSERVGETPLRHLACDEARPRDCLAIRLSRPHVRGRRDDSLTQCGICGKLAANIACEPLLVGGKVIGSVLVASPKRIPTPALLKLRDAVVQAAPIIAHQRNLAVAERRAASDALTGLPNRRAADETVKRMAAHASRSVSSLAAVVVDLDHFKEINDIHGHDQGDEALAAVANILSATVRGSDFAARYGGEEFLLLLPDTTSEQGRIVAEKVRAAIERAEIGRTGVTASFGVASLPADAADPESLLRKADHALYAAKQAGRNCVRLAAEPVRATSG